MEKESIFLLSLNPADFSQELRRSKRPRDRRQRSRDFPIVFTIVCISFQTPSSPNAILLIPFLWGVLLIHHSKQHCELRSLQSQHKTVELLLTFHHKIPRSTCSRPGDLLEGHQRPSRSKERELDQGKPNKKQMHKQTNQSIKE